MSVSLASKNGTIVPEYAAQNITFIRSNVRQADGTYVASFTVQIPYARTDFVVDADGNKIGMIPAIPFNGQGQDAYTGHIVLTQEDLIPYMAVTTTKTVFDFIADMADQIITEDLVKRGIIVL